MIKEGIDVFDDVDLTGLNKINASDVTFTDAVSKHYEITEVFARYAWEICWFHNKPQSTNEMRWVLYPLTAEERLGLERFREIDLQIEDLRRRNQNDASRAVQMSTQDIQPESPRTTS